MEKKEFFIGILKETPIFHDLPEERISTLAGCAKNVRFSANERIFAEGGDADQFFIIREGHVGLDLEVIDRGTITVQTLDEGDVLGWSWLFPPYSWNYGARAMTDTRMIALDAMCLRGKCESDPGLGYDLMKRFSSIMLERLQATRAQLMDIYDSGHTAVK